ncbi:MAG: ice-binding family protein [Bacteroidota bacterium]
MKNKLLLILVTAVSMFIFPKTNFGQTPTMGTTADFVLFTTNGAITNVGITHLTGHVGSNVGGSTGFGNVDGVMHDQDPASAQATLDLNALYLELDAAVTTNSPGVLLGAGMTLVPGVHNIPGAATMNGQLNLDAQNVADAIFIIQVEGAFGVGTNAKVNLLNGALACNVFWKVDGAVSLAPGVVMKGNIVAFNDFISMSAGDSLEGRALSINGAIGVTSIVARTPLGCLAPILTGPSNPDLLSTECFVLFSAIGPVTNAGITTVTGDVGTNSGSTLGFNPLFVTGNIHPVPDAVTAQTATDFTTVYNNLNGLPYDIELLYPAQFGNNLVLTPHIYLMNSAVTFTDSLYLNAQNNPDAVFVIQVNGAFGTSTYSNVILMNGAQAKNVYWVINGALSINDYSIFNGSVISQGAIDLLTGVTLYGRALTGVGAVNTFAIDAIMPTSCAPFTTNEPMDTTVCEGGIATFTTTADGVGLTYQWRLGNVNLVDGGNISGATTATLTINPATTIDAANNYNVIISGSFAPADTSVNVSLTIETAPVITVQPLNQTICEGDSLSFQVTATGNGLTYQWRLGNVNLIDNATISGSTTSQLTIDPAQLTDAALNYNVIVSNACLLNDTSNFVSLTVNALPLAVPTSNSPICAGSPINLSAQTVVGGIYAWTGPAAFTSASQNPSISSTTLSNAGYYTLIVSNGTCTSLSDSVEVILTICPSDLSVVKTASSMEPMMGEEITFTIAATNNGPSAATGVSVTDLLQNGYSFVSSTTTQGTYDPATGVWTIGNMANGAIETMTITAIVTHTGFYENTATISSSSTDNNSLNNTSIVEPIPFEFFIPEGFSPNGDGVNDLFVIRGISHFPENNIVIFNRWGNKVFEAAPYQDTWDGKSSTGLHIGGENLPVGTYFYVLELGDGTEFYKGTIYLNN